LVHSLSSTGRPGGSGSGRSASANSSRSTSFNLPTEAKGDINADRRDPGEEVEVEEEMDEESMYTSLFHRRWFLWLLTNVYPSAAAKHAAFVRARGRHYSNEAEAMKV
jgi:protein phosphatase inhibitor 2